MHSKPEYDADKQETIFKVIVKYSGDDKIVMNYNDYLTKEALEKSVAGSAADTLAY